MLNNLLVYEDWKLFNSAIETGLFVFILGILIVFLGMGIIVLVISGIGKIMTAAKNKKSEPSKKETSPAASSAAPSATADGVSQEVVAAITAAIACYYSQSGSNCEFVVKKIKKRG